MLTPPKHEGNLDDFEDLYDASSADEFDRIFGEPCSSVSTLEAMPIRPGRIANPPAGRTSQRAGQKESKNREVHMPYL